ncbi:hypothetical protein JC965_25385 [Aeromonas caviae]|uniref:Uncharacterized protein n=1 Tax=Aeromonas caviae TaxID=648 RepID=A0A7T3X2C4_AERCA|nr:hypothetical protein [Aeromonas caviae]QQA60942.1 hypothetical protein JC965_25385 [Aeromonas caviae]
MNWLKRLLLDLKGDIPVPGCLADGRVFNFPFNWLGLTELDPRQPGRQLHATLFKAAILVEVDEPDSVAVVAFFLEYGCLGGEFLIKAAHPRAMQILELLLEVVGICLGQKGHFWVFLPTGEHPVQLKGRPDYP